MKPEIRAYLALSTLQGHYKLTTLADLFTRLANVGLRPTMCLLAYEQLEFLGHIVAQVYVFPDQRTLKIETKNDKRSCFLWAYVIKSTLI